MFDGTSGLKLEMISNSDNLMTSLSFCDFMKIISDALKSKLGRYIYICFLCCHGNHIFKQKVLRQKVVKNVRKSRSSLQNESSFKFKVKL